MAIPTIRATRPIRRGSPYGYWDPTTDMSTMRAEMLRMLQLLSGGRGETGWSSDIIDIVEDDDGWTVSARLPGFSPDEVTVEVDGQDLTIEARSMDDEAPSGDEGELAAEFSYRFTMPAEADPEQIDATMEHGLLTVRIPRSGQARRRRVEIGGRRGNGDHQIEGETGEH